jgi:hypothetical protein
MSPMDYVLGWMMRSALTNRDVIISVGKEQKDRYVKVTYGGKRMTAYDSGVVTIHTLDNACPCCDGCIYSSMDRFGHNDILWCELEELIQGLNLPMNPDEPIEEKDEIVIPDGYKYRSIDEMNQGFDDAGAWIAYNYQ